MRIQAVFEPYSPWVKLLMLVLLIFSGLLLFTLFGMLLATPFLGTSYMENPTGSGNFEDPVVLAGLKYFQIISQLGLFILPAFFFTLLVTRERKSYLFLQHTAPLPSILGAALMLLALPLINGLSALNQQLELPASMAGIEEWMRLSEDSALRLEEAFIVNPSVVSLLVNILMMALLPALGEELLFRGIGFRLLRDITKSSHAAIWISAAVFSFIHFQFYGFLPRLMMGVLFGYLLLWSGSLWVPMIAHFVNNVAVVFVGWAGARWFPDIDIMTFGSSSNPLVIGLSTLISALIIVFLYLRRKKPPVVISSPNN